MITHRVLILLLGVVLALSAIELSAQVVCDKPPVDRPRIGLVLGGGGARGMAHIGVIRMLEELRVPVDYVAGTSMGALVGGMFATGMSADDLEDVANNIDWNDNFVDGATRAEQPFRRKRDDDLALFGPKFGVGPNSSLLRRGAIYGQKMSFLFQSLVTPRVQTKDFDKLPIPFRAVAADLTSGGAVVLGDGDLATAMRSSMSIPGVFSPVDRGPYLLVDGGIANNLPVDVARAMGADIVIAVDVSTPLDPKDSLRDVVAITNQVTTILVQKNTTEQRALLNTNDILLTPALGRDITSTGFERATREAMPIGYAAAEQARARLAVLALTEAEYRAYRAAITQCVNGTPVIQFVRLQNDSRFRDEVIEERIHVKLGQPLDLRSMDRDIQQIFGLGFLETVTYDVVEENGQHGVVLNVRQDPRGTGFIETGIDFAGDSDSSSIDIRLAYLKTDIDDLGSEFRVFGQVGENQAFLAELYKPLDDDLRWILLPRLVAERQTVAIFDGTGSKTANVQVEQLGASIALGREFWRHAALFGGVRRYTGRTDIEVGAPQPNEHFEGGEYFFDATWDRLDDRYFPSYGSFLRTEYFWSREELGASQQFEQLNTSAFFAHSWRRHTVLVGARYGTTIDGAAPVQNRFRAGGLFRLSGFQPDEISGSHFGMGIVGYRIRLTDNGFLPSYLGANIEYGNAAESRADIWDEGIFNASAYVGFNSPLGPLYAGYGFAEGGRRAYFLRIGTVLGPTSVAR